MEFIKAEDNLKLTTFIRELEKETPFFERHRDEYPLCYFRETEHGWFLMDGEEVAGYCYFEELPAHRASYGWALRKKYWGGGWGSKFMEKIDKEAKDFGIVEVVATVEKDNWRAVYLDLSHGFRVNNEIDNTLYISKKL